MSYIEQRVGHWGLGLDGEPLIAAVPALRGGPGTDIVIRIDGTYFGDDADRIAGILAHHREMLTAELRTDG